MQGQAPPLYLSQPDAPFFAAWIDTGAGPGLYMRMEMTMDVGEHILSDFHAEALKALAAATRDSLSSTCATTVGAPSIRLCEGSHEDTVREQQGVHPDVATDLFRRHHGGCLLQALRRRSSHGTRRTRGGRPRLLGQCWHADDAAQFADFSLCLGFEGGLGERLRRLVAVLLADDAYRRRRQRCSTWKPSTTCCSMAAISWPTAIALVAEADTVIVVLVEALLALALVVAAVPADQLFCQQQITLLIAPTAPELA